MGRDRRRNPAPTRRFGVGCSGVLGSSDAIGDHLVAETSRVGADSCPTNCPAATNCSGRSRLGRRAARTERVAKRKSPTELPSPGPNRFVALRIAYLSPAGLAAHGIPSTVETSRSCGSQCRCLPGRPRRRRADRCAGRQGGVRRNRSRCDWPSSRYGQKCLAPRNSNYVQRRPMSCSSANPPTGKSARIAGEMMRVGTLAFFEVDAAHMPRRKAGALAGTLESHLAYALQAVGQDLGVQALLKGTTDDRRYGTIAGYLTPSTRWCGTPPNATTSCPKFWAMRRRDGITCARKSFGIETSSSAVAVCAMSSSPSNCCRWCGRVDEAAGTGDRRRSVHSPPAAASARDDSASLPASCQFLRLLEHRLQLLKLRPHASAARFR